jgi:hypothetical protein
MTKPRVRTTATSLPAVAVRVQSRTKKKNKKLMKTTTTTILSWRRRRQAFRLSLEQRESKKQAQ